MRDIVDDTIFYFFFSDGLCGFAETLVESIKFLHNEDIKLVVEARNLSDEQCDKFQSLYSNMDFVNRDIDFDYYAQLAGVDVPTLMNWKSQVEKSVTNNKNYTWKLIMAAEQRFRSLPVIARKYSDLGYKFMLHSDVDMYFRTPINGMMEFTSSHDICFNFTLDEVAPKNKILAALIGAKLNNATIDFLDAWVEQIDVVPLKEKPRGYGQTALYEAYLQQAQKCNFGDFTSDEANVRLSKTRQHDADIWIGNSNQGRNRKAYSTLIFGEDLKERKRDPDSHLSSPSYMQFHFPKSPGAASIEKRNTSILPLDMFEGRMKEIAQYWSYEKNNEDPETFEELASKEPLFCINALHDFRKYAQFFALQSCFDAWFVNPVRYNKNVGFKDNQSHRTFRGVIDYLGFSTTANEGEATNAVLCSGALEWVGINRVEDVTSHLFSMAGKMVYAIFDTSNELARSLSSESENEIKQAWCNAFQRISAQHGGIYFTIAFIDRNNPQATQFFRQPWPNSPLKDFLENE